MIGAVRIEPARHAEIMSHVEAQFAPRQLALVHQYNREPREARCRALQTHNTGAMLPAEAGGPEAAVALSKFFSLTASMRKATFRHKVELRRSRTRELHTLTQLGGLLDGFEREASSALLEGRAILDRQRINATRRPLRGATLSTYALDTCIFNWLTDGFILKKWLPKDAAFAITHVQVDEINKTKDEQRRGRLALTQASLRDPGLAAERTPPTELSVRV